MIAPTAHELTDRDEIAAFLAADPALHIYAIGDLDPFFWPRTRWWGLRREGALDAIVLLWDGVGMPSVLAFERRAPDALAALIAAIEPSLPDRFHAHLSPGMLEALPAARWTREQAPARHLKMLLTSPATARAVEVGADAVAFAPGDEAALLPFYDASHPHHWFDPRMLETGRYYGFRADDGSVACAAGVHVYSPRHAVAALGNIATAPAHRRRGLARRATARLCQALLADGVNTIGLNVHAGNRSAIACYEGLGFTAVAEYDEVGLARR